MPRSGNPAAELEPCTCAVCGSSYRPYRVCQRACSRRCYRRLPDVAASSRRRQRDPVRRERANEARRTGGHRASDIQRRNRAWLLRRYAMTPVQYEALLTVQGGRCAICGDPPDPHGVKAASRLHVDHDHESGRVRGLLCNRCNLGLGCFRDDPSRLLAAVAYLKEHP